MMNGPPNGADLARRHQQGAVPGTRPCGFPFTTTGRPCANRVPIGVNWCRAGHPCRVDDDGTAEGAAAAMPERTVVAMPTLGARSRARRPVEPARRATELVRQAMASEDVEHLGLRADHVLGDIRAAASLLGSPDASPAARAAVVQRFGRVGALLVIGYEDRWLHAQRRQAGATTLDAVPDEGGRAIETLVREFPSMDAERVYDELCEIDRDEVPVGRDTGLDAHRWLDATYAVAARDGTTSAHRAYMCALDRVMRLVRPLVAS